MSALISGSIAYDNIMVFQDYFSNHILADKIHRLNVAFLVPEMRREFGGCAGNIAYNSQLLGDEPYLLGTVGDDFAPYSAWLTQQGIGQQGVKIIKGQFTGQAFITTDLADNQITAFHPGAMGFSEQNSLPDTELAIGIVSPAGKEGMLQHLAALKAAKIPAMFDPGQAMPMFSGEELLECIQLAHFVAVNDYEAELLQNKTGVPLAELATQLTALIVTRGEQGSQLYLNGECVSIAAAPAHAIIDPTGCGDAYRAGLLYGIARDWDWQKTAQLASTIAGIKIAHRGGQNHQFNWESLSLAYQAAYGSAL